MQGLDKAKNLTGEGLFKGAAFVLGTVLLLAVYYFQPKWGNAGVKLNQQAIEWVAAKLPEWWGDIFEAILKARNVEFTYFYFEMVGLAKLILLALGRIFRIS